MDACIGGIVMMELVYSYNQEYIIYDNPL